MICCLVGAESSAARPGVLEAVARMCSPRVMVQRETAVVFEAGGLARVLGPPADIAREITRLAYRRIEDSRTRGRVDCRNAGRHRPKGRRGPFKRPDVTLFDPFRSEAFKNTAVARRNCN